MNDYKHRFHNPNYQDIPSRKWIEEAFGGLLVVLTMVGLVVLLILI